MALTDITLTEGLLMAIFVVNFLNLIYSKKE